MTGTDAAKTPVHNVGGWVARWARIAGDRPAVADARRRLDWAGLEARTARLAGWLAEGGVGPGERVAILLGNRSAYLETVFAAARIGAVAVPVNARLAPPEIQRLFDDCRPAALVYEAALEATARKAWRAAARPLRLRLAAGEGPDGGGDAYEAALAGARPHAEVRPVAPDDPMMIMYTSGTTGEPKGAVLPHRKTLFNALNAHLFFDIRRDDRVLVVAPLFHSLGLVILSLPALYAGASLVLQDRFDERAVWAAVRDERITYMGGVPTMYQRLLDVLDEDAAARGGVGSLRFLFTAGAAIAVDTIRGYERHGLVLKQGYGQTETSILCCLEARDALRKAGSVGRPVFHAEVRVARLADLDGPPAGWRDAAPGETGEIVVRGPITMTGYWERPEATAETIRDGWLRTGDLATRDDEGYVTLVGRAREMFISGGENVYPAEVEACYREHPAVREIAVVGVPDRRWGEVGRAYVVPERGAAVDAEALRAWGLERIARFKVPREFVTTASLPKTASGKVQKHRLAR